MLERIEMNGKIGATYLDCYSDMTQDKTVTVHCICGRERLVINSKRAECQLAYSARSVNISSR